jgi:hypothetical protein
MIMMPMLFPEIMTPAKYSNGWIALNVVPATKLQLFSRQMFHA